ncbi:hypothetical protein KSP40_PGU013310 [Platanthera guangdongensis]|uniref:Secreted protein n=1 Tax=Platanthera guangdongensis TaxID=2320717 RepID=A0ABR2MYY4_9ASPA
MAVFGGWIRRGRWLRLACTIRSSAEIDCVVATAAWFCSAGLFPLANFDFMRISFFLCLAQRPNMDEKLRAPRIFCRTTRKVAHVEHGSTREHYQNSKAHTKSSDNCITHFSAQNE